MDDTQLRKYIRWAKGGRKIYAPLKYFRGITKREEIKSRINKMIKSNFKKFSSDEGKKTRKSTWTVKFFKMYPKATSLREKARVTKIPYGILKSVFDRGLSAWRTGHRPGATPQQWGYARVHSFIMGGPARKSDRDLLN